MKYREDYFAPLLGTKIKRLRMERGMTQTDLCGEGITRNMISQIETGRVMPSVPTLRYLAERLDTTAAVLISDDNTAEEESLFRKMQLLFRKNDYVSCYYCYQKEASQYNDGEFGSCDLLAVHAAYHGALTLFHDCQLNESRKLFRAVTVLEYEKNMQSEHSVRSDLYLAYIDAYDQMEHPTPDIFSGLPKRQFSCCDISQTAGIVSLSVKYPEAALELLKDTIFENEGYGYFVKGILLEKQGKAAEAHLQFKEAALMLCDPIASHCNAILGEACAASLKLYESAYAFSKQAAIYSDIKNREKRKSG